MIGVEKGLDCGNGISGKKHLELVAHDVSSHGLNGADPAGGLRYDAGDDRQSMTPQRSEGLQVGLRPGPA